MKTLRPSRITDAYIESACERLRLDKPIRRMLPVWGRLHIDRQLPFLFVYRRPADRPDDGTERLLLGEAAYLLASAEPSLARGVSKLAYELAKTAIAAFGAFLIVEVWSDVHEGGEVAKDAVARPEFRVIYPGTAELTPTADGFVTALRQVALRQRRSVAELVVGRRVWPPGLRPLLSSERLASGSIHVIGIVVRPIYRSSDHTAFPLVLRELRRELTKAVKRPLFLFVRTLTTHRPPHYHSLGRRAMVKAAWEVDRQLAEVSGAFDFVLAVTPVNTRKAWAAFRRTRFEREPRFFYRPLDVFPFVLKRKLFAAPIERVEDPELAWIFREKQFEIDRQLTAFLDRDTPRFLYASLQLYGGVDHGLARIAQDILDRIPPGVREKRGARNVDAETFKRRAVEELAYFSGSYPDMSGGVEIRNDVTGLMVSRGRLLIPSDLSVPGSRVEALIQHEVGTHLLTYVNGKAQPFRLLSTGLAGYEELQEGIAVLTEYLVGGLSFPRVRLLAARVLAVESMIQGATFVEVFRKLTDTFGFTKHTAFGVVVRVFRGGGLTKDAAYLRGLVRVLEYLRKGGHFEPLLVGKISSDHIPVVNELLRRQVLRKPPLRPRYLNDPAAAARLRIARETGEILDLVEQRRGR